MVSSRTVSTYASHCDGKQRVYERFCEGSLASAVTFNSASAEAKTSKLKLAGPFFIWTDMMIFQLKSGQRGSREKVNQFFPTVASSPHMLVDSVAAEKRWRLRFGWRCYTSRRAIVGEMFMPGSWAQEEGSFSLISGCLMLIWAWENIAASKCW